MPVTRRFMPGGNWIYFKVYSGPMFLEDLLLNEIYDVVNKLYQQKYISKFYFVRYFDESHHLRLRFYVPNSDYAYTVVKNVYEIMFAYVEARMISRVSIDTYTREFERYGKSTIEDVETLFSVDSLSVINTLRLYGNSSRSDDRWAGSLADLDHMLSLFQISPQSKIQLYNSYFQFYAGEHNIDNLTIVLDKKYRQNRQIVEEAMSQSSTKRSLDSVQSLEAIDHILSLKAANKLDVSFESILLGLAHMHFNRFFRSKQRQTEMVVYYFLAKYHKSVLSRHPQRQI